MLFLILVVRGEGTRSDSQGNRESFRKQQMFQEQIDRGMDYIDYSLGAATEAHCEKQLPDMTLAKAELQEVPWSH